MITEEREMATMTVEECAKYLRLSRAATYDGCANGSIPSVRVGRRILIPRVAIDRMLNDAGRKAGQGTS